MAFFIPFETELAALLAALNAVAVAAPLIAPPIPNPPPTHVPAFICFNFLLSSAFSCIFNISSMRSVIFSNSLSVKSQNPVSIAIGNTYSYRSFSLTS